MTQAHTASYYGDTETVAFLLANKVDINAANKVSVFVQLSSNGRTGIFSMVISWKFAQGPGAQFAFFLLGHHFCLRLTLRTIFFLQFSLLEPGRGPVVD